MPFVVSDVYLCLCHMFLHDKVNCFLKVAAVLRFYFLQIMERKQV